MKYLLDSVPLVPTFVDERGQLLASMPSFALKILRQVFSTTGK